MSTVFAKCVSCQREHPYDQLFRGRCQQCMGNLLDDCRDTLALLAQEKPRGVEKPQRRVVDKPTLAGKGTMKWLMNIFALILTTGVLAVLLWHQWDFPISATEKLPIVVFQLSAFMAGYTCCVWILSRKR